MMWINHLLNQSEQYTLRQHILAWANQVQGVKKIALWFERGDWFTIALLAAWQAGAEVCLLPQANADAGDALIWHDAVFAAHYPPIGVLPDVPIALAESARLTLFTSGSTGEPKRIDKTCAQMCAEAEIIAKVLPASWRGLTVYASVLPQHLYGLTFRVFTALRMAWKMGDFCVYPEDFTRQSIAPCLWLTSPTVLNHFGEQRDWAHLRSSVRGIISAGGMLSEHTFKHLMEKGLSLFDVYGSTETGVIAWRNQTGNHQLFPEVYAQLDEQHQLSIQSAWSDGKQHLADTADLNGQTLTLHGRSDRIIKLADKRIALNQIEQILQSHEWIADVHCTVQRGRVAAWVSLNAAGIQYLRQYGRMALLAHWRNTLKLVVDRVALPRYWRLTAQPLPRNAQAKIAASDVAAVFADFPSRPDWQCLQSSDDEWTFSGRVPVDLRYFNGHFETFPLVAGVVQVQWAMEWARQFDWGKSPISQIENLKYQQFIRPNDEVQLHIRWDRMKEKMYFDFRVADHLCASGRVVFAKEKDME